MKKFYLFPVLFMLSVAVNSQTLTYNAHAPMAGTSSTSHLANEQNVDPGDPGNGQSWDFSNLTSAGTNTTTFVEASSTPYSSSFPNANVAQMADAGTYNYYQVSSQEVLDHGFAQQGLSMINDDPMKFMAFPFSYGNSFSDNVTAQWEPYPSAITYRNGTIQVEADATGSIALPGGLNFTNTLRIKYLMQMNDSTVISGLPGLVVNSTVTTYQWFSENLRFPVLSISMVYDDVSGNTSISASYLDPASSLNDLVGITNFTVSPNPVADNLFIRFDAETNNDFNIDLYSIDGQKVASIYDGEVSKGKNSISKNVSDLPSGIYFVQIEAKGIIRHKKVIIR